MTSTSEQMSSICHWTFGTNYSIDIQGQEKNNWLYPRKGTNYSIFGAVFDTDYPARVWNDNRTAIPRAPMIMYHHCRRGISGCVWKFRFRTYDENMNELMEMRSRVHGESRILRNTREMIARQSLVNLSETSSQ